jgi:hypothetical protein
MAMSRANEVKKVLNITRLWYTNVEAAARQAEAAYFGVGKTLLPTEYFDSSSHGLNYSTKKVRDECCHSPDDCYDGT